ncbi:MAG: hypothetical protein SFU98_12395 [Leptospiraceae bacterium]|nr:hypothetical protein [Leptospiraceae bacterium]
MIRFLVVLLFLLQLTDCRRKRTSEDQKHCEFDGNYVSYLKCGYDKLFPKPSEINECDTMGNYYEDGEHYINREFVNDDGTLDYKKQFEKSKQQNHDCYPTKTFE